MIIIFSILNLTFILLLRTIFIVIFGLAIYQGYLSVSKDSGKTNHKISIIDKYGSIVPYWLPLLEGSMNFGMRVISQYPKYISLLYGKYILPLLEIYIAYPILAFVVFFLLYYLFIRLDRPIRTSSFVRFHILQAILLFLINSVLGASYKSLPIEFRSSLAGLAVTNILFLFTVSTIIYSVIKSIEGQYPEIPIISEAVKMQISEINQ
uniref:Tic20 family protein Ycf60 n=1 Tax=Hildenbrandia rivularis TaxID=135206 RepID=A0A1C9CFN4_9FLOR|nr:hypothetical protein Hrvl_146 [Hildenbrandia rivularis]AOM67206.1 hypothetical protein Hrvl_146 [Hildenbrandia rivularis]